jgi:hypothetical protein
MLFIKQFGRQCSALFVITSVPCFHDPSPWPITSLTIGYLSIAYSPNIQQQPDDALFEPACTNKEQHIAFAQPGPTERTLSQYVSQKQTDHIMQSANQLFVQDLQHELVETGRDSGRPAHQCEGSKSKPKSTCIVM